jgi:K+-sensing histidine kinase KdpD
MKSKQIPEVKLANLNVDEIIAAAVRSVEEVCRDRDIAVEFDFHNLDSLVVANMQEAAKVVRCLLQIAVKFSEEGGRLRINAVKIEGKRRSDRSDFLKMGICIFGAGISNSMFDVVIDKFQNLEEVLSRKPARNASLELTKSQQMVRNLGGNIWLKSEMNKGLTFYFTLPITTTPKTVSGNADARTKQADVVHQV